MASLGHLSDGIYDVVVVETELDDNELRIEVVITLGPRVGDTVGLRGNRLDEGRTKNAPRSENPLGVCETL